MLTTAEGNAAGLAPCEDATARAGGALHWTARADERLRRPYRYRELFGNLFRRDFHAKYKGSVLGVAWSLLNPLVLLGVYLLVFGVIFPSTTIRIIRSTCSRGSRAGCSSRPRCSRLRGR